MAEPIVLLLPVALLVAVVARELFRRASLLRRGVLGALATLGISLWLQRPHPPQEVLWPAAFYFGFTAGIFWDHLRRR